MYWINGVEAESIPADDRALHYGDGCFTTARAAAGEVDNLAAHLARMAEGCRRLAIANADFVLLEREMRHAAQFIGEGVVKAIVTRGSGGRGYSIAGCHSPRRLVSTAPFPVHYARQREEGIRLTISPVHLGISPQLAGIKHLNRLEQVLIKAHIDQSGFDDAAVLDSNGMLVECCAANLFWRKGNQVFTPCLNGSGVAGLMRRRIFTLLEGSEYTLHEVTEPAGALIRAEEVLICNSLMPVLPVTALNETVYASRRLTEFLLPRCLTPAA